jgi:FKBP12-rapamycin complex-associated protein
MANDAAKVARLGTALTGLLADADDPVLVETACRTMGRLVKGGGALTSDIVEAQIRRALSWCEPRQEVLDRRIAAVTLLRELAEQAPAVFNVHVKVGCRGDQQFCCQ